MLLYENIEAKILSILKMGINPFERFVSTGEIKENFPVVKSRTSILNKISNIINDENNFVLPIIGGVGIGKTHLFWALKNKMYRYNFIYISLNNVYKKFFYNLYSEFIENIFVIDRENKKSHHDVFVNLKKDFNENISNNGKHFKKGNVKRDVSTPGIEILRVITRDMCKKWGGLERKYGFFHIADLEKVKETAYQILKNKFKDDEQDVLKDVINIIVSHQLDPENGMEAERWLLGELMDLKELSQLNMKFDLRKNKAAFIILKLFIENSNKKTVLFIDDFDILISLLHSKNEYEEQVFDPSWLYGDVKSPDEAIAKKLLKNFMMLHRIEGLKIIITLKSLDELEELKMIFRDMEEQFLSSIKEPIFLLPFNQEDVFEFYKLKMRFFYDFLDMTNISEDLIENCFPIGKERLIEIYESTGGNPREITKKLVNYFNDIIAY